MRRLLLVLAIVACLVVLAVSYSRRHAGKQGPPRPVYTGAAAVVERFQCHRCHDAPEKLLPADRPRHCVRCHQDILAGELDSEYPAEKIAQWKHHITNLVAVPSLTGIDRHLTREWLIEFLQHPHDLRPELPASMPRLRISAADAQAIADHFIPRTAGPATPPAETAQVGDVERGRGAFARYGCGACHHFSGAGLPEPARTAPPLAVRLAPDLRHTRERMNPEAVLSWLSSPAAIKSDTLMPRFALTEEERRDLAAFVVRSPLDPPPAPPAPPQRPPVLERRVSYAEVEARVFKKICWHCHSDPEPVGGDGGPGNTGGFGFAGKGLDFGSHAAVVRGGALETDATGTPRVIAAMLARHVEAAGGEVPGKLGMPLGLPPMSLDEIRLVDTWIAQGARGPE